jgi:hypothetical protein
MFSRTSSLKLTTVGAFLAICVILAHPQKGSFNHAIAEIVIQTLDHNGYEVILHDLYGEKFDPLLPGGRLLQTGFASLFNNSAARFPRPRAWSSSTPTGGANLRPFSRAGSIGFSGPDGLINSRKTIKVKECP